MTAPDFDVLVLGGGPAGAVTGGLLARAGYRVAILEKDRFPRRKICGEGILPGGVEILRRLGLGPRLEEKGARPFHTLHLHLCGGLSLHLDFRELDSHLQGWLLPRDVLDGTLAEWASRQGPLTYLEEHRVVGIEPGNLFVQVQARNRDRHLFLTGRTVVHACGIHSRWHPPGKRPGGARRIGLVADVLPQKPLAKGVYIFATPEKEAYVAPLTETRVHISLLLRAAALPAGGADLTHWYLQQLQDVPLLWQGWGPLRPLGPVRAISPLTFQPARTIADHYLSVGDAAGSVDPITGQGITLALKNALCAAQVLDSALQRRNPQGLRGRDLVPYQQQHLRTYRSANRLSRFFLTLLAHPRWAEKACQSLQKSPPLRRRLTENLLESRSKGLLGLLLATQLYK